MYYCSIGIQKPWQGIVENGTHKTSVATFFQEAEVESQIFASPVGRANILQKIHRGQGCKNREAQRPKHCAFQEMEEKSQCWREDLV